MSGTFSDQSVFVLLDKNNKYRKTEVLNHSTTTPIFIPASTTTQLETLTRNCIVSVYSARIAAGAWWIGVLIITASYTANLAAFLTIKASAETFSSLRDLAQQTQVQYGTILDSQIQVFFDTANRDPYM